MFSDSAMDIPPTQSVAPTRRVTWVLHCTVHQRPSTRPSESFYNNFVHFELKEVLHSENVERLLKKKRHVRELTHKLVSKANNLNNNIFIVVNSL